MREMTSVGTSVLGLSVGAWVLGRVVGSSLGAVVGAGVEGEKEGETEGVAVDGFCRPRFEIISAASCCKGQVFACREDCGMV